MRLASASRIPTPTGGAEYGNEFEVKGSGERFCHFRLPCGDEVVFVLVPPASRPNNRFGTQSMGIRHMGRDVGQR
jgi:hypothetical protein